MTLVEHYGIELHQMDVKMSFLKGFLNENIYLAQLKGFVVKGKEHMGCHLKKSIYGLKKDSRQWYLKFDETIRNFGFKKMRRIIAFMQCSRIEKSFSSSYMWTTFYLLVVMLIYY
jgi:hypothetical protein